MAKPKAPSVSKLSPTQQEIKRLLDQGKTPEQIAKKRKTSTNAVYQTVRRLKALGFTIPGTGNAAGNGGARRPSSRSASASRGRSRGRGRGTPTPPVPFEVEVVDPNARITEAKEAVKAERTTLAKQQDNLREERDKLLAQADEAGKTIDVIDVGIARLDHVLEEFDAKVEVASS